MSKSGKSWFKMQAKGKGRADISIFNEIGAWGVTAQDFAEGLQAFGPVGEIHLAISSDGGDVSHGTAIYNILNRHKAHKVVTIEGLAASMASVIAMAGDEIIMPANAMMMIHNPWGGVMGDAEAVKSFGEALEMMQDNIAGAYVARTGISEKEILSMMDKETWLKAERAVSLGFADRVEEARDFNARAFDTAKFNRTPKAFRVTTKGAIMAKTKADVSSESESDTGGTKSPADIRKEVVAANKEIRSMCALAGSADKADEYIDADLSVSQVVNKLAEHKAEVAKGGKDGKQAAGKSDEISAHNRADNSAAVATIDVNKIYGNWNKRTK